MATPYGEAFAHRLKTLRKDRGYTQYTFADALNTPRQNIQGYETAAKFPKYEMLVKICKLLGVSGDYMLGMDEQTMPSENQSIFVDQIKGLEQLCKDASRERQKTVDSILKDVYAIMEAALVSTDDKEVGLYIDLFDVAHRIIDATHGHEQ